MGDLKDDIKPAGFTGAATAVMGSVGGLLPAAVHTIIASGGSLPFLWTLTGDVLTVAAIGVGQGLVAFGTALYRRRGEHYISPKRGLVGALSVAAFNGLMYFVQMAVPGTELGWTLDLIILAGAGAAAGFLAVRMPDQQPAVTL